MDSFVVVYPINIFVNPIVKQFFTNNGVEIDEDSYALSELIQFIYRSRIRQSEYRRIVKKLRQARHKEELPT